MSEKKPYTPPQILRVELNHEQAILSACSLMTTAVSNGMMVWCRANCKSHNNFIQADSGARPS